MIHRQSEIPPDTPAGALPRVALVDILERGDLEAWLPLARAIQGDPTGELAITVRRLIDAYPMYGTSALWRVWIDLCQARAGGHSASEPGIASPPAGAHSGAGRRAARDEPVRRVKAGATARPPALHAPGVRPSPWRPSQARVRQRREREADPDRDRVSLTLARLRSPQ